MNESAYEMITGIGVVIDDKIHDDTGNDGIINLKQQLDDYNIPLILLDEVPSDDILSHYGSVCFFVLDWEFSEVEVPVDENGVPTNIGASRTKEHEEEKNIGFIKGIREHSAAPVFILSHLKEDTIKRKLDDAGVPYGSAACSRVFVKHKADLKSDPDDNSVSPLLKTMQAWIEENPPVYLLNQWTRALQDANRTLFLDLYDASPGWPGALWQAGETDGVDPRSVLTDTLLKNIRSRMGGLALSEEKLRHELSDDISHEDMRKVLESAYIIPAKHLPPGEYGCGDIFKAPRNKYIINIRCDCDCVVRGDKTKDNVLLYLLDGKSCTQNAFHKAFKKKFGLIPEQRNYAYVFPLKGKCVRFNFNELMQVSIADVERDETLERVGRLTAPHITDIRQCYGQWLQRGGMPRIPEAARGPGALATAEVGG